MPRGLVVKSTGIHYWVKSESGLMIQCTVRGKMRTQGIKSTNPIAVGDWVNYVHDSQHESGIITSVETRKNYIIRKSTNLSKQSHIIAANVDLAFLVVTLSIPETTRMFIDRFLVSAEAYHIPVVLLFNKMDLYQPQDIERIESLAQIYRNIGYDSIQISAHIKTNYQALTDLMRYKFTVLAGHSGVGKSSIINALNSNLNLKVNKISLAHLTGKHTTTFAEMHQWEDQSYVIDTPGIRAFGLLDFKKEEFAQYFPEILKWSPDCRFQNCTHIHEPGCAVKAALNRGEIDEIRFQNYQAMYFGDDDKHRL